MDSGTIDGRRSFQHGMDEIQKEKERKKKSTDISETKIFENVPIVSNSALYFPDYHDDMYSFSTFVNHF